MRSTNDRNDSLALTNSVRYFGTAIFLLYVAMMIGCGIFKRNQLWATHPKTFSGLIGALRDAVQLPLGLLLYLSTFFNFAILQVLFFNKHIHPKVPHYASKKLGGFAEFNSDLAQQLQAFYFAHQEKDEDTLPLVTFFFRGIFCYYILSNHMRHEFIQEGKIGVCSKLDEQFVKLAFCNNVMHSFLLFRSIHTTAYQKQRAFLVKNYHTNATDWLAPIQQSTDIFLKKYLEKYNGETVQIRSFIMRLVLRNSSYLLGLTDCTLDFFYDQYAMCFDDVAHYTVFPTNRNAKLENQLNDLFHVIFKNNFDVIQKATQDTHYVQCLFGALGVTFPASYKAFIKNYAPETRFKIAMNFASVCLAGMAHSTTNNFDWALARLLKNPDELTRLKKIVHENPQSDCNTETFSADGCFFEIAKWIVNTVYEKPTFGHEFFSNNRNQQLACVTVARGALIIANYQACNRANAAQFHAMEDRKKTLHSITRSEQVASFGGSKTDNKNNNTHTRACPGAATSLYEQAVMLVMILRRCHMHHHKIDLSEDPTKFPIVARVNTGEMSFAGR